MKLREWMDDNLGMAMALRRNIWGWWRRRGLFLALFILIIRVGSGLLGIYSLTPGNYQFVKLNQSLILTTFQVMGVMDVLLLLVLVLSSLIHVSSQYFKLASHAAIEVDWNHYYSSVLTSMLQTALTFWILLSGILIVTLPLDLQINSSRVFLRDIVSMSDMMLDRLGMIQAVGLASITFAIFSAVASTLIYQLKNPLRRKQR